MKFSVVKVGGSLFDLPDLTPRLRRWIGTQAPHSLLLIAGGGPLANAIRQLDCAHQLGEERAHWLAIEAMNVNGMMLAAIVRGDVVCTVAEAASGWEKTRAVVLDPRRYCRDIHEERLPHSWEVTSDSIAASIAMHWHADRLVLLKSAPPPGPLDCWSAKGYCDPQFNHVLGDAQIAVEAFDLRGQKS